MSNGLYLEKRRRGLISNMIKINPVDVKYKNLHKGTQKLLDLFVVRLANYQNKREEHKTVDNVNQEQHCFQ